MSSHVEIQVRSTHREQLVDVTQRVRQAVKELGLKDGVVHVYCPHTTAGLLIQENADPDLREDLIEALAKLAPRTGWRHREGNGDAHIKAVITGASAFVPVRQGSLLLGTWQNVYLGEFDGPRQRTLIITALESAR